MQKGGVEAGGEGRQQLRQTGEPPRTSSCWGWLTSCFSKDQESQAPGSNKRKLLPTHHTSVSASISGPSNGWLKWMSP